MAEKKDTTTVVEGQKSEGHGDSTQPAGIQSPATFAPLSTEPKSANQKTEAGRKGTQ